MNPSHTLNLNQAPSYAKLPHLSLHRGGWEALRRADQAYVTRLSSPQAIKGGAPIPWNCCCGRQRRQVPREALKRSFWSVDKQESVLRLGSRASRWRHSECGALGGTSLPNVEQSFHLLKVLVELMNLGKVL